MSGEKKVVLTVASIIIAVMFLGAWLVPNEEQQRLAIDRVLTQDDQLSKERSVIRDIFSGGKSTRDYVCRLSKISFEGCPPEFTEAYQEHIKAWQRCDSKAIHETWNKVIFIANEYGVKEKN